MPVELKTKPAGTKPRRSYAVKSMVRTKLFELAFRTSGDYLEKLDDVINGLIVDSTLRARANGRVTVKPQDL